MGVSKYKPEYAEQVEKLCLLGATRADLGELWGVNDDTISKWMEDHPEFGAAFNAGKIEADAKVVRSLFERANGYSHPAVKIFMPVGTTTPVYAPYTQYYPPDTLAARFWLMNRQQAKWRERHEFTGADGGPLTVKVVDYATGATALPNPPPETTTAKD